MDIFMHLTEFSTRVSLILLAALFLLVAVVLLFFFVINPLQKAFYAKYDSQKGQHVTVSGRIIEKRYDHGLYFVYIEIDGIVEYTQLPRELFQMIQVGSELEMSALYGKLSKRILAVKPMEHINTYA